tara:strand:- start:454 stop:702 length:249 start_codon:yes stop_codon:yes gene_type:complete
MEKAKRTFKITVKAGHPFVGIGTGEITKEGLGADSMRELLASFGILETGELHGVAVDEYPVTVSFKMTASETHFPHDPTVAL